MYTLSICIPARQEEWLPRTVQDLLDHTSDKTEILVGLDGYWPDEPLPDHARVRILHVDEPIGQRAMQNRLVQMSSAKYVAKTDAHCAFDKDFDTKMLSKIEDDITMVAVMRNLHVFDWVCSFCEARVYQGPQPEICPECQSNDFKRDIVWIPKTNPQSSAYRFNKNLQFKYFPELRQKLPREGLQETMSLQGSFFMCAREKYWQLQLCDESWGSWGNQGSEVSIKTWLSGGRVLCNFDTWYAHLFRTQQGFSFPYPQSGSGQERARKISRDLFLNNRWDKQVRPLSWILERFWDSLEKVGDKEAFWGKEALRELKAMESSITFPRQQGITGLTSSSATTRKTGAESVPADTMSSSGLNGAVAIASKDIDSVTNESKMVGIDTAPIVAEMVNDGDVGSEISSERTNQPSIHNPMYSNLGTSESDSSIPEVVAVPRPLPATSEVIKANLSKQPLDKSGLEAINSEPSNLRHSPHIIPRAGILYFTDNELPLKIAGPVQRRIRKIAQSKKMELVSSTRKPTSKIGRNVVTKEPRGVLTMFKQILKGLEAMDSEIVFFAEHDCLYPPEHFDFTPPDRNVIYFDHNWYKVHTDGLVTHWDADQVSGMCAYRDQLIPYYKERIATYDKKTFDRKFEPYSGERSESWQADVPYIDLRTGRNITYEKRSIDDFRNKDAAVNFTISNLDNIPGWKSEDISRLL